MTATLTTATDRDRRAPPSSRRRRLTRVVVDGLTKRFGSRTAVDEVSFAMPTGTVAGLIGPNGAGKTTIMAMLLGLVQPDERHRPRCSAARSAGAAGYLHRVGALIEGPAFHPAVSGIDNLRSLAVLGGHSDRRTSTTSSTSSASPAAAATASAPTRSGMKQRLGIAAALLGDPELVILDEPTNGLDPVGMQDVRTPDR